MKRKEIMAAVDALAALMIKDPENGDRLFDELIVHAEKAKCVGDFRKRVKKCVGNLKAQQFREKGEASGRETVILGGINDVNEDVRYVGTVVAQKQLGFTFGGMPVMMLDHQSAIGRIYVRNENGEKVLDAEGEPETEPAVVTRATKMSGTEARIVSLDACTFFTMGDSKLTPAAPPMPGLMPALWAPLLPPLAGIAKYPVMWKGEFLTGSGYHVSSGLYLQSAGVDVTWEPTVEEAVAFLRDDWLGDFPFEDDHSFANALFVCANMVHARTTLRDAMGPPGIDIGAPSAGVGKSLLTTALAMAVTGMPPPVVPYAEDETERKKAISTAVREGWPLLNFDNIKSGSDIDNRHRALTQLITAIIWSDRALGAMEGFEGPAGLTVVVNGSNLNIAEDMARRFLRCRLVPRGDQNLATRDFRHKNLLRWTVENRGKILAALKVIMAVECSAKPIGGFPEWSRVVAHPILTALGIPVKRHFAPWIEAAEQDAQGIKYKGMYDLLRAISAIRTKDKVQSIDGEWFTTTELVARLKADALQVLMNANYDEIPDARGLGALLNKVVDNPQRGDDGVFTIRKGRVNLGKRTNGEERVAFRVRRNVEAKLPEVDDDGRQKAPLESALAKFPTGGD